MKLPGDCQINLQASSLGVVAVGAGDGDGPVGVGDSVGSRVADGVMVGVLVGTGVVDGLGVSDSVGWAVHDGDGVGVPLRAVNGADSATQATRGSTRPARSNAFFIATFCLLWSGNNILRNGIPRTRREAGKLHAATTLQQERYPDHKADNGKRQQPEQTREWTQHREDPNH